MTRKQRLRHKRPRHPARARSWATIKVRAAKPAPQYTEQEIDAMIDQCRVDEVTMYPDEAMYEEPHENQAAS